MKTNIYDHGLYLTEEPKTQEDLAAEAAEEAAWAARSGPVTTTYLVPTAVAKDLQDLADRIHALHQVIDALLAKARAA